MSMKHRWTMSILLTTELSIPVQIKMLRWILLSCILLLHQVNVQNLPTIIQILKNVSPIHIHSTFQVIKQSTTTTTASIINVSFSLEGLRITLGLRAQALIKSQVGIFYSDPFWKHFLSGYILDFDPFKSQLEDFNSKRNVEIPSIVIEKKDNEKIRKSDPVKRNINISSNKKDKPKKMVKNHISKYTWINFNLIFVSKRTCV